MSEEAESTHVDAYVARTWISYRCAPCHPWCTHPTSLNYHKKKFFSFIVTVNNSIKVDPLVFLLKSFVITENIIKRPVFNWHSILPCIIQRHVPAFIKSQHQTYIICLEKKLYVTDKWVPVTTAWRVLGLRMEEWAPIWRAAANILTKQSRIPHKWWSSSMGVGQGANNSMPLKLALIPVTWTWTDISVFRM